jgi:hypothetical protein
MGKAKKYQEFAMLGQVMLPDAALANLYTD